MKNFLTIIGIIFGVIVGPLALIWSVNTLFGLGIQHSITNWFAGLVLLIVLQ